MFAKIKLHLPQIITVGIYFALFTSLIFPYADKDWGWHYKYGEYFLENGKLLVRDIYSWTLAGYAWINHSWLFDPILYILYNNIGYIGLSLAAAAIGIVCFYLITDGFKLKPWQLAICAIFFGQMLETGLIEGLRSQVLALLPLGILMYLLKKGRSNPKLFSFIPPLFLIWANLHGTFAFGILILGVFFAAYFFEFKEYRKRLVIVGLLALFCSLLNPFTYHSYLEVLRHTSSPYLKNIFEWLPIYAACPDCHVPTFSIYLVILLIAAIIKPQKSEIPYFLIVLGLTYQAIQARRYLPLFDVATIPLLASFLTRIKFKFLDLSAYKITAFLIIFMSVITIQYNLTVRLPSFNFYKYSENDFCLRLSGCPMGATEYIKKHPPIGNGFNFYDWGGYMIGHDFPVKLFVDGRMHLWGVHGYSPFGDYIKMYYNGDKDLFNQYDFDWALVQSGSPIAKMIEEGNVGNWRLAYYDEVSRYYIRIR